jgi:hypothetical protein
MGLCPANQNEHKSSQRDQACADGGHGALHPRERVLRKHGHGLHAGDGTMHRLRPDVFFQSEQSAVDFGGHRHASRSARAASTGSIRCASRTGCSRSCPCPAPMNRRPRMSDNHKEKRQWSTYFSMFGCRATRSKYAVTAPDEGLYTHEQCITRAAASRAQGIKDLQCVKIERDSD